MQTAPVRCRSCGGSRTQVVLSYGRLPLAEVLLREDELHKADTRHPLTLVFCPQCALVQTRETIDPSLLYTGTYVYYSSAYKALTDHFRRSALHVVESQGLGPSNLVIEIASNDGYMLRVFRDHGVPVLGIDPARGPAEAARKAGVPTVCELFDSRLALHLRAQGKSGDVVLANNVFNLIPDPADFVRGLRALLNPGGLALIEVPYVARMVETRAFDNVFHQNTCYFSLTSAELLLRRESMVVTHVEEVPTFGGSLRLSVAHRGQPDSTVARMLEAERREGVGTFEYYRELAVRASQIKTKLLRLLRDLKAQGKRIVAYGAAGGMATTLLNFAGVTSDLVDYAVDLNRHKHGLYTPGVHLRIHGPERLLEDRPDYVLLLAWNYAAEIMEQQAEFLRTGGRFIVPVPEPRVVPA